MAILSKLAVSAMALAAPTRAFERLSSGRRLNRAQDDPAGYAMATRLDVQVRSGVVASRNIMDALAAAQKVDDALALMGDNLKRMREITIMALSDTTPRAFRLDQLLSAFWGARSDMDDTARNTSIQQGGSRTLQTGFTIDFGIGTDGSSDSVVTLEVPSIYSQTIYDPDGGRHLGQAWLGIPSFVREALRMVDAGIDRVNQTRSNIGSFVRRLEHAHAVNDARRLAQQAAHARIADADMAEESVAVVRGMFSRERGVSLAALVRQLDTDAVRQLL